VSEVAACGFSLPKDSQFVNCCRELLHSSQLDVSYFAGGVLAHLLNDNSTRCLLSASHVTELCSELVGPTLCSDSFLLRCNLL